MQARGSLLAQFELTANPADSVFSNPELRTEVTAIYAATGPGASFRLHHDDAGTSDFSKATALYFDKLLPANDTFIDRSFELGASITLQKGGQLAASGVGITLSLYGITESVVGPVTGVA